MSIEEHRKGEPANVRCAIMTVSDTRTVETDKSGKLMMQMIEDAGFEIVHYHIVKDHYEQIQSLIRLYTNDEQVDAILISGGTGIARSDITYEAVSDLLFKELQGFGELFRYLSFTEEIGAAAMLSRAVAGTYKDRVIFSMPGSSNAVKLALSKLILPELKHVIRELRKERII